MPNISAELAVADTTLLFEVIVEALIPLLTWLFWDLERRRQRWLGARGWLSLRR